MPGTCGTNLGGADEHKYLGGTNVSAVDRALLIPSSELTILPFAKIQPLGVYHTASEMGSEICSLQCKIQDDGSTIGFPNTDCGITVAKLKEENDKELHKLNYDLSNKEIKLFAVRVWSSLTAMTDIDSFQNQDSECTRATGQ